MSATDEAREGALRRVKAMLAMSKDAAASEGERENALRMAHKTMAKHGIEQAEAEAAGKTAEEHREGVCAYSRNQPWTRRMAHAIADLFMCEYYYSRSSVGPDGKYVDLDRAGKVRHVFVGRASNAVTAADLASYVIESTMKEANRLWKKQADPGPWWSAFCKGAAARIYERCQEIRAAAEAASKAEAVTGRELVLASLYKTEKEKNAVVLRRMVPTLVFPKSREQGSQIEGYRAGKKFGDGVSLNKQVKGEARKVLS